MKHQNSMILAIWLTTWAVNLPAQVPFAQKELADLRAERQSKNRTYLEFMHFHSLWAGLYELPRAGFDRQEPHTLDELYYVIEGEAIFEVGRERHEARAGSIIYVEAGQDHRFTDISRDLSVLVFFSTKEPLNQAADPASSTTLVAEEKEILALCERSLEQYSKRQFDDFLAAFSKNAVISIDPIDGDAHTSMSVVEFVERSRPRLHDVSSFREGTTSEPKVMLQHNTAMVWASFEHEIDGQKASGLNAFTLQKHQGQWQIVSLALANRQQ